MSHTPRSQSTGARIDLRNRGMDTICTDTPNAVAFLRQAPARAGYMKLPARVVVQVFEQQQQTLFSPAQGRSVIQEKDGISHRSSTRKPGEGESRVREHSRAVLPDANVPFFGSVQGAGTARGEKHQPERVLEKVVVACEAMPR
jgi:hypothetical protein